jgi:heme oxygenase
MVVSEVQRRLRNATASAHVRLEANLNALDLLSALSTRVGLIRRYYIFHSHVEAALTPHLKLLPGLAFASRCRASLLAKDLIDLGCRPSPDHEFTLSVSSQAEALGGLYVLEGSTLGGRAILQDLSRRGASTRGLNFLDPYGANTGKLWRSFLNVLERETASREAALDETVSGGVKVFAFAEDCLCKKE